MTYIPKSTLVTFYMQPRFVRFILHPGVGPHAISHGPQVFLQIASISWYFSNFSQKHMQAEEVGWNEPTWLVLPELDAGDCRRPCYATMICWRRCPSWTLRRSDCMAWKLLKRVNKKHTHHFSICMRIWSLTFKYFPVSGSLFVQNYHCISVYNSWWLILLYHIMDRGLAY